MDEMTATGVHTIQAGRVRSVPPFVGRRHERAWIEHVLEEVVGGCPRVILLSGDAGIGKTRLLNTVRQMAARRGMKVCYGRCYEDLPLPYLPFVEALLPHLEQIPEDIARALGPNTEVLRQFLHPSPPGAVHDSSARSHQSEQDQLRLFVTLAHATLALAQQSPVFLIVDDLHWADPSSLDLFGHLVFTAADTAARERVPVLICATYRPYEPEGRLTRLIARLRREDTCHSLALAGLDEPEIQELIEALGLSRPSHQLVATLSAATQGNPLFIQEVVHHLRQEGTLQKRGGYLVTPASPADLRLPDQVTGALAARTQKLNERSRPVLTLAACLGNRFSLPILNAVTDVSEEELLDLLEEAMQQGLLLSEEEGFQFAHPLIRHVFYRELSVPRRQRFHHQIGLALEHLYANTLAAHVFEIAHHLLQAGPVADITKVVAYARQAADQAFAMFAWGEAARYYEAVISAADSGRQLTLEERAELHYRAGLAHYRDQDVGPCLDHYENAIEAYRQAGNVPGLARALMEKIHTQYTLASVPFGTLVDVRDLEHVLRALGDREAALCASILTTLSGAYWAARQTDKAAEMARRSLAIGQQLEDDQLCAYASFGQAMAHMQNLHVREALGSYQNALVHAQRTHDLWLQGLPLQRMPLTRAVLGQLQEAEVIAQEACELTRRTHDWANYSLVLSALASLAVARGDFDMAETRAHEAILMAYRSRYPWGGARSVYALACARAQRGAWVEAEDALDLLLEPGRIFEEAGPVVQAFVRAFRHLLRAYAAVTDEAASAPLPIELVRAGGLDSYALAPCCALVEIAQHRVMPEIAEQAYQALLPAAERGVLFSTGWVFLIPRILGVAESLHQRWEAAEAHFRAAIDVATDVGARPELGRAYLDYACMLAARGRRRDRHRALDLVNLAGPVLQSLDMEPFLRRTTRLVETLHGRLPVTSVSHAAAADMLTKREVEVLLQMAQGRTKQEIGDELMLGVQTIDRHLRTLFKKIGVNSQEAAASYASQHRLDYQHRAPGRDATSATHADTRHTPEATTSISPQLQAPPLRIILVTDMEGSTSLIQRWGDAQAYTLLRFHNTIIRQCLSEYQGSEITHTGDGVMASFASATSAITCAIAIQRGFAQHNQEHANRPIRVRIGINAGEPIPTEGQLFGAAVHTAFRICSRAKPNQILVAEAVHQLAAGKDFSFVNRGRLVLRGFPGRFRLYEVQWTIAHV